jgi:predicted nuclease with TOPRIM domain
MSAVETLAAAAEGPSADTVEIRKLERENAYLKLRCAQLQDDVTDLSSQLSRLQQEVERLHGRTAGRLAGAQP